jgi:hypothetical protein
MRCRSTARLGNFGGGLGLLVRANICGEPLRLMTPVRTSRVPCQKSNSVPLSF